MAIVVASQEHLTPNVKSQFTYGPPTGQTLRKGIILKTAWNGCVSIYAQGCQWLNNCSKTHWSGDEERVSSILTVKLCPLIQAFLTFICINVLKQCTWQIRVFLYHPVLITPLLSHFIQQQ